ncbi:aminotransferase class I/II-fold pyridoxal phosphate-dependent enzyme [Almyronema epifaneia]|uniref:Aminotransferase class I/II-fold pyridoxal phosphate-dependent enzyme n=1 Tax=Almyronema epifaneia S1 TaxID=2991925 RepID=A0ABW6IH20_9CYAN
MTSDNACSQHSVTDQNQAPLVSALQQCAQKAQAAFYTPGHKRGQGAAIDLRQLIGVEALRADLPELPELDNLFAPTGPIQTAQTLAAKAFGAEETFFLANGSTCGLQAALLAVCSPGDQVLVPRHAHRSVFAALVLSGAIPVWLQPPYDATWDVVQGTTLAQVDQAIAQHPDLKAVLLVSPTYLGVCSEVAAIAERLHLLNCPLIVDEAHGAHFGFHTELPQSALSAGADIVVQSTHKVLAALTQASMLHVQGQKVNRDRLRQALQITQSSSPNYLLLASLDAARQQMATAGTALITQTLKLAQTARSQLSRLAGLRILAPADVAPARLDLTRLTVEVAGLGLTGFAVDEWLHTQLGVTAELPSLSHLTFIISLGNTVADVDQLVLAFKQLVTQQPLAKRLTPPDLTPPADAAVPSLSPRQAFFSPAKTVTVAAAIGQISAELICPYPPGIPLIFPGERIESAAIAYLQAIRQAGGQLTGCSDASLQTIKIVNP